MVIEDRHVSGDRQVNEGPVSPCYSSSPDSPAGRRGSCRCRCPVHRGIRSRPSPPHTEQTGREPKSLKELTHENDLDKYHLFSNSSRSSSSGSGSRSSSGGGGGNSSSSSICSSIVFFYE